MGGANVRLGLNLVSKSVDFRVEVCCHGNGLSSPNSILLGNCIKASLKRLTQFIGHVVPVLQLCLLGGPATLWPSSLFPRITNSDFREADRNSL